MKKFKHFQRARAGKNVLPVRKSCYFFESDILNPAYCLTHSVLSLSLCVCVCVCVCVYLSLEKEKKNIIEMSQIMDFQGNNCTMVNS